MNLGNYTATLCHQIMQKLKIKMQECKNKGTLYLKNYTGISLTANNTEKSKNIRKITNNLK